MNIPSPAITRRHALAATGAAALTSGLGLRPASAQMATIRQGYQTNIWGMPTYYLMKSGYLEKRGIKDIYLMGLALDAPVALLLQRFVLARSEAKP